MADSCPKRLWQVTVSGYYSPKITPKLHRKKPIAKSDFNPPKHEIDAFARCILPAIQAYFDSEEGRREFMEWCKQQAENKTA
mgnify:CR=1 FL=1